MSVFVMLRSDNPITVVFFVAELFPDTGSEVGLLTVATLLRTVLGGIFAFTNVTRVRVAVAPGVMLPMVHVGADQLPTEGEAEIKVRPEGKGSETITD